MSRPMRLLGIALDMVGLFAAAGVIAFLFDQPPAESMVLALVGFYLSDRDGARTWRYLATPDSSSPHTRRQA